MRKLMLVFVPVVLAGCGELLSVRTQAREVCVRQTGQSLPGISALTTTGATPLAGLPPLSGSISDVFPLDVGDIADFQKEEVGAKLGMRSFSITGPAGAFAGLERLNVRIDAPPGSALPPLSLADFPASIGGAPVVIVGDTVTVDLSVIESDLLQYVQEGTVDVVIEAEGELPVDTWNADVEVCASADARYDYGEKLGL